MDYRPLLIKVSLTLLCVLIGLTARPQKLPGIQRNPLRAPQKVLIDGKNAEWGNFQAYNNSTQVAYLIANDDEYLYLVVKATDHDVINREMTGIKLFVSGLKFKNDQATAGIIYPLISSKSALFFPANKKIRGTPAPLQNMDSLMGVRNKLIAKTNKLIGVSGIKGLDTLSIYNDEKIKAAGLFDRSGAYICEVAIALKYLNIQPADKAKLYFHFTINGANSTYTMMYEVPDGPAAIEFQKMNAYNATLAGTTDFWGEYTLAK